jgi:hypothetical protein
MTPEEQRIAIAEACGWAQCIFVESIRLTKGFPPPGNPPAYGTYENGMAQIPNYLNDLNAMQKAEGYFTAASDQMCYALTLLNVIGLQVKSENDDLNVDYCWHACTATATQRAEAFLKTLNLWKEN